MIEIISKSRINNIYLDISKDDLLNLDYPKEQFQICFSQNSLFVRSISVIVTDAFWIDGVLVELGKKAEWYCKENPLVESDSCYIFPKKNLAICDNGEAFEVTLYSSQERTLYERALTNLPTYNELKEPKQLPDTLFLKPYVGLGILELGSDKETVHRVLGKPLEAGERMVGAFDKGAYIEEYSNLSLRYDDNILTEIHLYEIPNIYYEDINLSVNKDVSELKKRYSVIPKWSYSVIPELGITLGEDELFIYTERIRDLWLNSKRPITSW